MLTDSHNALDNSRKNESLYNTQLAKIYCQKAQCYNSNNSPKLHKESIELYETAAKLDSTEANIKLGKVELCNRNYIKALKYFKNTTCISSIEDAFNKLFQIKKSEISEFPESNTKDIAKSSLELVQLCLEQVKIYNEYELTQLANNTLELTKVIYLDTIAKLKNIGGAKNYDNLADMYNGLANITSSPYTQRKYLKQAEEYSYLAKKFNKKDLETNYDTITTSTSHDSYFKEPLLKLDELINDNRPTFNSWAVNKPYYGNDEDLNALLGAVSNPEEVYNLGRSI